MYILGINMSHDRSACLLKDGRIAVAISEERLDRDKRSVGLLAGSMIRVPPLKAITYCLKNENIGIDKLDLIVADHARGPVNTEALKETLPIKNKDKIRSIPHPSHHLAHAYGSYFCSPFKESAILIADTYGSEGPKGNEGESGFYAKGNRIEPVFRSHQETDLRLPMNKLCFSLTYIYHFVTLALGFKLENKHFILDEAGKTMALAAYGKPVPQWPEFVELLKTGINNKGFIDWALKNNIGKIKGRRLCPISRKRGQRITKFHANLAFKVQQELERGLIHYAKMLRAATGSNNLCVAGGAGLNCLSNRKILDKAGFKNIFFLPPATDDGNAIGCAMYGWHNILGRKNRFIMTQAYLGKEYKRQDILLALKQYGLSPEELTAQELLKRTARFIASSKIIGWFQGGSEFGPRALGHRSILADPRRKDIKNMLNRKIKNRSDFQPYAPSILAEFSRYYFDTPCESPFMLLTAKVRKDKIKEIPGVIHIDGTARVQTVTRKDNGIFYDLIKEFHSLTGLPLVLNTSFNIRGRPIVETPQEALRVFFGTDMEVLVLGNFILDKSREQERDRLNNLRKNTAAYPFLRQIIRGGRPDITKG